jgi:hypothetical protein
LPHPLNSLRGGFGADSKSAGYVFRPRITFGKEDQYEAITIAQLRSKLLEQYRQFDVVFERFHSYSKLVEFMRGHGSFVRDPGFQQIANFAVHSRVSVTPWRY